MLSWQPASSEDKRATCAMQRARSMVVPGPGRTALLSVPCAPIVSPPPWCVDQDTGSLGQAPILGVACWRVDSKRSGGHGEPIVPTRDVAARTGMLGGMKRSATAVPNEPDDTVEPTSRGTRPPLDLAPPAPGLESDRALLDAFRRGESGALGRVLRMYVDDVARALRRGVVVDVGGQRVRLGANLPETDVESLLQDTFVRAFSVSAREAYDGIRPYSAYLLTIARNLLIDHGRRLQRESRLVGLESAEGENAAVVAADAEESVHEKELSGILDRFRSALEEDDQRLFQVRYEEQHNLSETARLMGWSEIRVRKRDTWIRSALLDALRAGGFLEHVEVRIGKSLLARKKK